MLLAGCSRPKSAVGSAPGKELTPEQYQLLSDKDKIAYKNVLIRVPETWGGALLPPHKGPYDSTIDKAVHGGDIRTLMGLYNQALFELRHPRVKVEYIPFDMWSPTFPSVLAVAISSNRAPSYYIARDLPATIEKGMYADLTDLMKQWDQYLLQPEGSRRQGTVNGRIYTLAGNELGAEVIRFRKDWFKEAGIFNEYGEPGPRTDWTWDDFRAIAKKLSDPSRKRYGYCGEMGDFKSTGGTGVDYYIPDPAGKKTWVFNQDDPLILQALQRSRDIVNKDKSVNTSVSTTWYEWHQEFDAGHAAMIQSFAPHVPNEFLRSPRKFGEDKPYGDTVGMAPLPRGSSGLSGMEAITNPVGFDPTLSKEQLAAAFEWCKDWFYGDAFANRVRQANADARAKGNVSTVYSEVLALPYKPNEQMLDKPLAEVFPKDYLRTYNIIRKSPAKPLPREFGLKEPGKRDMDRAMIAMYAEAITTQIDLKALLAKTANLVNATQLNFRGKDDAANMQRYLDARSEYYRKNYPRFFSTAWQPRLTKFYVVR